MPLLRASPVSLIQAIDAEVRAGPKAGIILANSIFKARYSPGYDTQLLRATWTKESTLLTWLADQKDAIRLRRGLWWNVTPVMHTKPLPKTVVRNYAKKRLQRCWIQALEKRGYDKFGVWKGLGDKASKLRNLDLTGTLLIMSLSEAPYATPDYVQKVIERLADQVVRHSSNHLFRPSTIDRALDSRPHPNGVKGEQMAKGAF